MFVPAALVALGALQGEEVVAAPAPSLPAWMEPLAAADASTLLPQHGARARKVTLEGWTRNAYAVTEDAPLELQLHAEPGMRLELGFAIVLDDPERPPRSWHFVVDALANPHDPADPAEEGEPLFSWELDGSTSGRFMTDEVDLTGFAGRELSLTIRVVPGVVSEPAAEPGGCTTLVAEPVLLRAPADPRWNVVLISLDTLRADRLSCYGNPRRTSPRIDAIAAEGVRFARNLSAAPWTAPSHMSLLTGLYPSAHHVNESFDRFSSHGQDGCVYRTLDRSVPTLAERLRDAGWRTHALTAGACVEAWVGFDHGFDSFHSGPFKLEPSVPQEVAEFLRRHASTPFFLFLHTYEVHEPYLQLERARKWLPQREADVLAQLLLTRTQEELGSDYEALGVAGLMTAETMLALYDAGIETADAYVGFVVDRLRELGLWDRTLLVVTSDHGQEIGDRDPGTFDMHGHTLYDELLHVPLVMHLPGDYRRADPSPIVVDGVVQSVDVVPTILELLGLEVPAGLQGMSHAELARNGGTSERPFAIAEATEYEQEWKALCVGRHKLLAGFDLPSTERSGIPGPAAWEQLYDVASDPREREDLAEHAADLLERLRDRLLATFAMITRPVGESTPGVAPTEEMLERLRELGYVR